MPISSSSTTDVSGPSEGDITSLIDMGFTRDRAKKALGKTVRIFLFELVYIFIFPLFTFYLLF